MQIQNLHNLREANYDKISLNSIPNKAEYDQPHNAYVDDYEIQNDIESNNNYMQTDENADFKRAILQLIFVDDLVGLQSLLQLEVGSVEGNNIEDMYNLMNGQTRVGINLGGSGLNSHALREKVNNLNWHDQHIKTNLDSKISPLCQASFLGRKRMVDMMLTHFTYLDLNLETQENGYTPLSSACMAGNYEIVCLLAQNGADVNKVDYMEQSPLIYCFSRMNEDENYYENKSLALKMAEVLLQHGADPNQFSQGRTILMNFCR